MLTSEYLIIFFYDREKHRRGPVFVTQKQYMENFPPVFLHYFYKNMKNSHKSEIYRFCYANKLVGHHSHHIFSQSPFNYLNFPILHKFTKFLPKKTSFNLITFFPIFFTLPFFNIHYYYSLTSTQTKNVSIPLSIAILQGHYYFRDKVQNSYVIFADATNTDMRNCPEPISDESFKLTQTHHFAHLY